MVNPKSGNVVKDRICPVCKAVLKGKAAMRKHLQSKHPTFGQPRQAVPRANGSSAGGISGGKVFTGTDIISSVTIGSKVKVGAVVVDLQLNPRLLQGTRIQQVSRLFARWRPKSLVMEVKSSSSKMVGGLYLAAWSPEADEKYPQSGVDVVKLLGTWSRSAERQVASGLTFSIPVDASRKWYTFDSSSSSDNVHGTFAIVMSSPISGLQGEIQLSTHLRWSIELDGPELDTPKVGPGNVVYADEAWTPYFTDSSSDWAGGKRLTFKAHQGGATVPFPTAQHGVVYRCLVKYQYYKTNGTVASSEWGVIAKDFADHNIMACFETEENAKKYIETGDLGNVLTYYAAGPFLSPANPGWLAMGSEVSMPGPMFSNRPKKATTSKVVPETTLEAAMKATFDAAVKPLYDRIAALQAQLDLLQRPDSEASMVLDANEVSRNG